MNDETIPFQLDLISTHGAELAPAAALGDSFELREWTSWLRVRSDVSGFIPPVTAPDDDELTSFVPPVFEHDGLATLVVSRSWDDQPGEVVGLFYMRLEADALAGIREAVEGTPWLDLPRPVGGGQTAATIRLHYASRGAVVQRTFNAASGNFIEAIGPLWKTLNKLSARVMQSACATLTLRLDARPSEQDPAAWVLVVELRNLARDPVVFTDPRVPTSDDAAPRLELRFGREPLEPSWSLVESEAIPVPEPAGDAPRVVTLAYRKRLTLELPWRPPGPGRYRILAAWRDYGGPVEPVPGQIPFMPLPQVGPPYIGSGPYPIRGASFARAVVDVPGLPEGAER